jgi:hypothetical protein
MNATEVSAKFWSLFCTTTLYECGFGDAVNGAGAREADEEHSRALSYLTGYAHACRLANQYMTPQWQICNLVGIAAATLRILVEEDNAAMAVRVVDTYEREFKDLLERKAAAA